MRDREYLTLNTMEAANSKTGGIQISNKLANDLLSTVNSGLTDEIIANNLRSKLDDKNRNKYDLDHLYTDVQIKGTLLHQVAKKDLPKSAKVLIENGANPDSRDLSGDKYCPLHYAAEKGHPLVMKILLDEGANPNATEALHWRCSLHLLVENFKKWKPKDNNNANPYNECLDILLKNKRRQINVNIMNKDRITPIFLAASKKWSYMVQELIKKGADLHLVGKNNMKNVDDIESELQIQRRSIKTSEIITGNFHYHFHELKESLKRNNIDTFKNILKGMEISQVSSVIDSEEDQGMTLLQCACENGQSNFVDVLLNHGADPVKFDKTNLYSPILYACEKGFSTVLEVFMKHNKLECGLIHTDRRGETVIHKVVKQEYKKKGADYNKCLEILLRYKIDVDAADIFGNTPLHHAALQENQSLAKLLLIGGAHLGIKNDLGIMAITNIKPTVLEEALNNSIKLNRESDNKEKLEYKSMEVILNYKMFVPTNGNHQPETECIKFLSSSHDHRHLLRHPVINTFLSLKWQKISKYYTINLLSYIFYLFVLTAYILNFHGTVQDSDTSTTSMKTADSLDIQHRFSDNFALNISLQPIITSETNATENIDETADSFSKNKALKISLQTIITFITICIAIKELIQIFLSCQSYFSSFKNWLEIAIVIMTFVLLFADLTPTNQQSLSAWIVLISWTIFILILGCHPSLAIYITMFRRVTHNFTKLIFLFSFMIGAFSLSFYLIFQIDENFMTIQKTIMKTIAMSTGELEYTDLPLADFPVTSHILFVLFILFILMVIMNLINGLAVSDIHMIQLEAEIYSYKNRVELISYLESAFLTHVASSGGNCFRNNFMTRLLKKIGPSTLLMFPTCLRKQSIKMYPNNNRTKEGQFLKKGLGDLQANQASDRFEICTCDPRHHFSLEQSQIESTMSVVLADKVDVAERINKIEDQLESMDRTIEKTDVSCHVNNVVDRITQIENHLTNLDTTIASLTDILKAVHTQVTSK